MSGENRNNQDTQGQGMPPAPTDAAGQQSSGRSPSGPSPLTQREPLRQRIQKGPAAVIVSSLSILLIILSAYLIFAGFQSRSGSGTDGQQAGGLDPSNALSLRVFFPREDRVALEQRPVPKVSGARDIAAAAVREFLSGPSGEEASYIPDAVELTGVFMGQDGVLYIDFSSAMTLNFQGDAVAEFLLLRSLYRTLKENTQGVRGYRLLVDGREVDTIGGHIYILDGLEKAVPYRLMEED